MAAASAGTLLTGTSSSSVIGRVDNAASIQQQHQHQLQEQLPLHQQNHHIQPESQHLQQYLQQHRIQSHQTAQSNHPPQSSIFQILPNALYKKTSLSSTTPCYRALITRTQNNNHNKNKHDTNVISEYGGQANINKSVVFASQQRVQENHQQSVLLPHQTQSAIGNPNVAPGWQRHTLSEEIIYVR